jgi:spermidine synthase
MAFFAAAVTIVVQVLVHRIVSAKLLNNYAFLVIGLTMLGFALSGVVLSRTLAAALRHRSDAISAASALFVLSLLGAVLVFHRAESPWGLFGSEGHFFGELSHRLPLALPFAVPFAFCGVVLGILLSSPDAAAGRVYFADLVGSALGAFAVIGAISAFGVERSLLASAALMLVAALVLHPPRSGWARGLFALGAVALALGALKSSSLFFMRYPASTILAESQVPGSGYVLEHTAWDAIARIEVTKIPPRALQGHRYPSLLGSNRAFHARFERVFTQNNYAFTYALRYDGRRESLRGIEETIYAAAYEATSVPHPRAFIIGVGGGFDILTALNYEPREVTAVEVNSATVGILRGAYKDYFRAWVEDPRVRLVQGEGRHVLAASADRYDVLQLSGVDSYSGTPGAAHVFSESYLYTAEAFDLYLSRLTDQGMMNMMRLEYTPPMEMLRAVVTAVAALRRAGAAHPERHIVMLTSSNRDFTAMLVKKTPFTSEEEARVAAWSGRSPHFAVSASPSRNAERKNMYQAFLDVSEAQQRAFPAAYDFDISPATDDRPFFFNHSRWSHLRGVTESGLRIVPVLEYTLVFLLAVIGAATVLCVAVPLWMLSSQGLQTPHAWRHIAYFAGIGVGFMAIEMALLQKFGLFLGHPNYALSVVLAALLFFSGLGALASGRVDRTPEQVRYVSYALGAVILAEHFFLLPHLGQWVAWRGAARVALVFALVAPIGIPLGMFFPAALERVKQTAPALAPWAWGTNGIFSVLAPVLAVAFSTTWGMNALLLSAIPIYIAAAAALPPRSPSPSS